MQQINKIQEHLSVASNRLLDAAGELQEVVLWAIDNDINTAARYSQYLTAIFDCMSFMIDARHKLMERDNEQLRQEIKETTEAIKQIRKWESENHEKRMRRTF